MQLNAENSIIIRDHAERLARAHVEAMQDADEDVYMDAAIECVDGCGFCAEDAGDALALWEGHYHAAYTAALDAILEGT